MVGYRVLAFIMSWLGISSDYADIVSNKTIPSYYFDYSSRHPNLSLPKTQGFNLQSIEAVRWSKLAAKHFKHYPIYPELKENTEFIFKPIDLVTSWRFDVIAKYIYAKHRELAVKSDWAKNLYAEHLKVWGNFKESWPPKNGLEDFLASFHATLDSVKKEGFSAHFSCVPIDSRKIISNGAHRLAACLLYNKDVVCKYYSKWHAPIASAEFFKINKKHVKDGLAEKYLDAMALEYCTLKKNTYIAHIFPIAKGKDEEIRSIFTQYGNIVYEKKVYLHHEGPFNFIRMIYDKEDWLGSWHNDFSAARHDAKKRFPKNGAPFRIYLFECESLEKVKDCKAKIRKLFGVENYAIHINDTPEQTLTSAQALFNQNSIHMLNYSKLSKFPFFEKYFNEYSKWLKASGVNQEHFCVDSSAILSVYGIRDCKDLDFIHHGYDKEANSTGLQFVSSHNAFMMHHTFGLDDIIFNAENYFYYKGLKFAAFHVVKSMKEKRNEEKDRKDLSLIEKHFKAMK